MTRRWQPSLRWLLLGVLTTAALSGCRDRGPTKADLGTTLAPLDQPKRDYFGLAIDFLHQRDEHNLDRSGDQALYYLNCWIRDQTSDPRWKIDRALIKTLPLAIDKAPATKDLLSDQSLQRLQFNPGDVVFLEENRWLRGVARWVAEQPPNEQITAWTRTTVLSRKAARNLALCEGIFDWTVRHIQLEELRPYPQRTVAGPITPSEANQELANWPPPMRGIPGPGYEGLAWHVLLYGRGDMYQRARIFMLLARQLHIDSVMLAIDQKGGRAKPWLPAVILDNQLFLFDVGLGLAIPGPNGIGIATLDQVIADPSLLESLDVGERYQYPVRQQDLSDVVALIDATPEYLAQRMLLVEKNLDAANQMVLSCSLAEIKRSLEPCRGVKDVRLWAVPIEATIYYLTHLQLMASDPGTRWNEFIEHGIFQGLGFLVQGRRQHLLGRLDNDSDQQGAKAYYLLARTPKAQIDYIDTGEGATVAAGLKREKGMTDSEWENRVEQEKRLRIESKEHASYWLGLAHGDNRDFAIATNWLKTRTLESTPDGPFTNGARYNLARCYEELGRTAEARKLYLVDESPQRHGNLIRARRLQVAEAGTE